MWMVDTYTLEYRSHNCLSQEMIRRWVKGGTGEVEKGDGCKILYRGRIERA